MDSTQFSTLRYHHQQTTESLLDESAPAMFPEISKKAIDDFRDIYGPSAYVCRYMHCIFSKDGFDSSSKRATHEMQHQRRFRCVYSSCIYFASGFTTRNALARHNTTYHLAMAEGPSLAEIIAPPHHAPEREAIVVSPFAPPFIPPASSTTTIHVPKKLSLSDYRNLVRKKALIVKEEPVSARAMSVFESYDDEDDEDLDQEHIQPPRRSHRMNLNTLTPTVNGMQACPVLHTLQ
jgi:hypothetical protein